MYPFAIALATTQLYSLTISSITNGSGDCANFEHDMQKATFKHLTITITGKGKGKGKGMYGLGYVDIIKLAIGENSFDWL